MKFVLFFLFVLIIQTINASPFDCPENAQPQAVGGSNCHKQVPTCQDPNPADVMDPQGRCLMDLIYKCWCDNGYLMNNGQCVLKEKCPIKIIPL